MNTSSDKQIVKPRIFQALLAGFNTVANKPYLILFPILLDLFLWFGPSWRVDGFFLPLIQNLPNLPGISGVDNAALIKETQAIWREIVTNFDLSVTLRTLPIGIPSLMTSKPSFINPLGHPITFNLDSIAQVFGFWVLFLLAGYFLGSLYLNHISKQIVHLPDKNPSSTLIKEFFQVILMPVILLILLLIISIPLLFIFSLITLMGQGVNQFLFLIIGTLLLWILMPLIFTPHAIFLFKQNLVTAIMTSISVVKISMGKTAWFVLSSLLLIQGLNYLWTSPDVDNWFLLIGIMGHAFIVSAVITASFYYFIDAAQFAQAMMLERGSKQQHLSS